MDSPFDREDVRSRLVVGVTLAFASAFPVMLLAVRVKLTAGFGFGFLIWNLFLAWIPLVFALVLEWGWRRHWPRLKLLMPFAAWLIFFPNSPYLVTDLVHLQHAPNSPLWFDALILMSMGIAGLLVGYVSLYLVQLVFAASFGKIRSWIMSLVVLGLCGFGIYLGRFARYNSWDILSRPRSLLYDVRSVAFEPLSNKRAIAVSIIFTSFLVVTYGGIVALGQIRVPERDVETDFEESDGEGGLL